jgi:hypothetical protein
VRRWIRLVVGGDGDVGSHLVVRIWAWTGEMEGRGSVEGRWWFEMWWWWLWKALDVKMKVGLS